MRFNCEKCGACCMAVKCSLLTKDNLCSIYENRPEICRVDRMFELTHKEREIPDKKTYYEISKECCKKLRR